MEHCVFQTFKFNQIKLIDFYFNFHIFFQVQLYLHASIVEMKHKVYGRIKGATTIEIKQ